MLRTKITLTPMKNLLQSLNATNPKYTEEFDFDVLVPDF